MPSKRKPKPLTIDELQSIVGTEGIGAFLQNHVSLEYLQERKRVVDILTLSESSIWGHIKKYYIGKIVGAEKNNFCIASGHRNDFIAWNKFIATERTEPKKLKDFMTAFLPRHFQSKTQQALQLLCQAISASLGVGIKRVFYAEYIHLVDVNDNGDLVPKERAFLSKDTILHRIAVNDVFRTISKYEWMAVGGSEKKGGSYQTITPTALMDCLDYVRSLLGEEIIFLDVGSGVNLVTWMAHIYCAAFAVGLECDLHRVHIAAVAALEVLEQYPHIRTAAAMILGDAMEQFDYSGFNVIFLWDVAFNMDLVEAIWKFMSETINREVYLIQSLRHRYRREDMEKYFDVTPFETFNLTFKKSNCTSSVKVYRIKPKKGTPKLEGAPALLKLAAPFYNRDDARGLYAGLRDATKMGSAKVSKGARTRAQKKMDLKEEEVIL